MRATMMTLMCLLLMGCSRSAAPTTADDRASTSGASTPEASTSGASAADEDPPILVAFPTCRRDYTAMCEEHHADALVIECLRSHEAELRSSCRAALNPEETPLPPPSRQSSGGGGGHGGGAGGHSH